MQLHDNIIALINSEAKKRGWTHQSGETSCADLEREIGFTRATWSRILRKQHKTISDEVVDKLIEVFDMRPLDLLEMSIGELSVYDIEKRNAHFSESSPAYNADPIFTPEQEKALRKLADKAGLPFDEFLRRRADAIIEAAREIYPDL